MPINDTYRTLAKVSDEVTFKDRGSKFIAQAFPVESEEKIKDILEELKRSHSAANHWCYAWQLGMEETRHRSNDDGEPANSAGTPIYGQIKSFDLTDVLVVVTRYFGGTKLGVGGLKNAYKTAAQMALVQADQITRTLTIQFELEFDYPEMGKVMRMIRENNLLVAEQQLELNCRFLLQVRKKDFDRIQERFSELQRVSFKKLPNQR